MADSGSQADALSGMLSFLPEWCVSLVTSLGLYFLLVAMGYAMINQMRKAPPAPSDNTLYARFTRWFVFGYEEHVYQPVGVDEEAAPAAALPPTPAPEMSFGLKALLLSFCTCGLLGSYLLWGVLQEKIITTDYEVGRFKSSIFLVFCNRAFALVVALLVTSFTKQPALRAPHYKYSFTSLSNVLSSWCQLEALKYISFPTQVLAKSSKMIPVMLMGKLISSKTYPTYDYVVAVVIGLGVTMFTLNNKDADGEKEEEVTSLSGIILIVGYLMFDSFTSQWQGHLFKEYKMSSYQMMLGVNSFSCFFSFVSLLENGELFYAFDFISKDPEIGKHILLFSIAGATGQMFIFYTIKTFGPLVFTMIMTTRQLVAIILSCIIFGHIINTNSVSGAALVFAAVIYRIWRQQQGKKDKPKASASPPVTNNAEAVTELRPVSGKA
mmetsp:Transcript_17355/g.44015  ORF Transcript_17355/g.44015 Transcript_17355/m.44015 type:complete len:438 (+) Transcript_17355:145-1458(+)